MGKKNKRVQNPADADKNAAQQPKNPQQPAPEQKCDQTVQQKGSQPARNQGLDQQNRTEQGKPQENENVKPQQGAWGGPQQQGQQKRQDQGKQQKGQQRGPGQQDRGPGQQRGTGQQDRNENVRPQEGAFQQQGQQKRQDQGKQQGAWGGQQQHSQGSQQHGAPTGNQPQQSSWRDGQQDRGKGQQRGPGQQDRGPGQQRGTGQQDRNENVRPQDGAFQQQGQQKRQDQGKQQGAWGGQQQHSQGSQQHGAPTGNQPQQSSWRDGQQDRGKGQQRGPGQQDRGPGQQRGTGQQDRNENVRPQEGAFQQQGQQKRQDQGKQQGAWGGQQQHSQGSQQHGAPTGNQPQQSSWMGGQQDRGKGQQRGPGQQDRGTGQHRGPGQQDRGTGQQRGPGQQDRAQGHQSMSQGMAKLSVSEEPLLPAKPKSCNGIVRGTLGRPGSLEVNYLKLDLKNMPDVAYHYDVTITPDRPKKFLRPAFEQCRREKFPDILSAFDGSKNCYTLKRLTAAIDHKLEVPDSSNRMKEFHVQIKETDNPEVDLNSLRTYQNESVSDKPMRALQVLEVVLASNNHDRGIRVGRSFFTKPKNPFDLEEGFEAWTGLFQAAILGEQPFLNVDIAHKSFPRKSTLIDYLRSQNLNIQEDLSFNRYAFRNVQSFLKGIDIIYVSPPCFGATDKKYKVLDIGEPASKVRFTTDDGRQQTVAEYFQSRGYRLAYPNLNCLKVGSTVRSISLPMELCSIAEGQALNRKDGKKQVEKMCRYAATSTNIRKGKIMDLLEYFEHNNNPIIRAFGLQIGSNFIKVPMRLLQAPYMEYLQGRTVTTSRGAWRMDGMKFLIASKPPSGHKWAIIYEDSKCKRNTFHDLENFKQNVIQTSQSLNMNLANDAEIFSYNDVISKLRELHKQNYDLVFVVLSDRGTTYAKVKQNAELVVGILTQCIKEQTVYRTQRDRSVFSNILLKVNAKLNGTNHKIAQDTESSMKKLMEPIKGVMYLGADVTHPSPDQREIPSVVGSAASHDLYGACYNCQYRLQRSTVENIEDMEGIVLYHLDVYYRYQKSYPSQIIYYRDGVSDGQFPIVKREELRGIKSACKKKGCNPKLTCVIVVKRHHTRFFPLKAPRDDRDFNNVEAGTVVDQHITHPNEVQFFMVSHQSIQGTAKPTRYNVIVDESNYNIDLLQKLTYNLCHMFPRCNRAVSYPAPAYLAHLVAFRGRVYLEGTFRFNRNLAIEYENRTIKPEFMMRNPMYFV